MAVAAERDPLIINGHPATPGAYPWMTALVRASVPAEAGTFCGGALIAPRVVLTAAHCVVDRAPSSLDVVIGRYRRSDRDGERIKVARIASHPNYDPGPTSDDAALLKLGKPSVAPPLALVGPGDEPLWEPGRTAHLAGWGILKEGGVEQPNELYETEVAIVTDAECAEAYRPLPGESPFKPSVEFCAGAPGTDTCQGDSGGPLFVDDGAGGFKQAGIVSYGIGCARKGIPGVYSKVAALRDFILAPEPRFAPFNREPPKITGKPRVSSTVRCRPGKWSEEPRDFIYVWGIHQPGQGPETTIQSRKPTLKLPPKFSYQRIACKVTGHSTGGYSSAISEPVFVRP
ncbi:MAG: S1 family peptidase [Solirubrobacterales bacterium]